MATLKRHARFRAFRSTAGQGTLCAAILLACNPLARTAWAQSHQLTIRNAYGTALVKRTSFDFTAHVVIRDFLQAGCVQAVDLNTNGHLDVLAAAFTAAVNDPLVWAENVGGDGRTWNTNHVPDAAGKTRSICHGDIDRDENVDIIAADGSPNRIAWWANTNGTGMDLDRHELTNELGQIEFGPVTVSPSALSCADMDGDTYQDIVAASASSNTIAWWKNPRGTGKSGWEFHEVTTGFGEAYSICTVDIDGDKHVDILAAANDVGGTIKLWANTNGTGTQWSGPYDVNIDGFREARSVFAGDLDGDRDNDVLAASYQTGRIMWWENQGSQTWSQTWPRSPVVDEELNGAECVYATDIEGDGDLDVIAGGADKVLLCENVDGSGTNWLVRDVDTGVRKPISLWAGDMDGDTNQDILAAVKNDGMIVWWENDADWLATFPPGTNTCSLASATNFIAHLTSSVLTNGIGTRLVCTGWERRTDSSTNSGKGNNTGVFALTTNAVITFNWVRQYLLSVHAGPNGAVCGTNGWYNDGANIVLTAVPEPPHVFDAWTATPALPNADENPLRVPMDRARTLTATFLLPNHDLTVSNLKEWTFVSNTASIVASVAPPGTTTSLVASLELWANITNTIVGSSSDQWEYRGWTLTGSDPTNGSGTNTGPFALTSSATLEFEWGHLYRLRVEAGSYGSVEVDDGSFNSGPVDVYDGLFEVGSTVAVTAVHDPLARFIRWTGNVESGGTMNAVLDINMDTNRSLAAEFFLPRHELIVTNLHTRTLVGFSSFIFAEHMVPQAVTRPAAVHGADLDRDNDTDILVASSNAHTILWLENTNSQGTGWEIHVVDDNFSNVRSVFAADMDGDTNMDVIAASYDRNEIAWWANTNGSKANWDKHCVVTNFNGARSVMACDVNGDTNMDVIAAAETGNRIAVWLNEDGSGTNLVSHTVGPDFQGAYCVRAADVDGDGHADVLGAAVAAENGSEGGRIAWWANTNGTGTNWAPCEVDRAFPRARSVFGTDVDGDGDTDIVGASHKSHIIKWWENEEGGSWPGTDVTDDFNGVQSVQAADLDGDGDGDIIGAAYDANEVAWWRNQGDTWHRHTLNADFDKAYAVHAVDMDEDGDTDILGAAYGGNRVAWWENDLAHVASFDPTADTNTLDASTNIFAYTTNSVVGDAFSRNVCTGWVIRTPISTNSGKGNNTGPFAFITNAAITFHWDPQYRLNTEAVGPGSVEPPDGWYSAGTHVTVTSTPNLLAEFIEWTGELPRGMVYSNAVVLVMDRARAVSAHFRLPDYTVEVANAYAETFIRGTNGRVAAFDVGGGTQVLAAAVDLFAYSTSSAVGNSTTRQACTGWTRTGISPPTGTGTNTGPFNLTNHTSITFHWALQHWLDTEAVGPGSVDPTDGWHNASSRVTVTAIPDMAAEFAGWSGDVPAGMTGSNRIELIMDRSRDVSAGFRLPGHRVDVANLYAWTFIDDSTNGRVASFDKPGGSQVLTAAVGLVAYLTNSVMVDSVTQQACIAWTRTGSEQVSGFGPRTDRFNLTEDTSITFEWYLATTQGTPCWWLHLHGLTTTNWAAADTNDIDGDGMPTWGEYIADTVPTDSNSVLRVLDAEGQHKGPVTVRWQGGVEAYQYLEHRDSLVSTAKQWITIFTNEPPTAVTTNLSDSGGTNLLRVYRVRAARPSP
ncbi:FG-GAP-like repeat-containing protein [Verrucomicrobiota bacterium]